jgi:hypothetical protein
VLAPTFTGVVLFIGTKAPTRVAPSDEQGQKYREFILVVALTIQTYKHKLHTNNPDSLEQKLVSSETAKAFKTIRGIIESFPEYGVVDLFGLYRYEVMKENTHKLKLRVNSPVTRFFFLS